MTGQLTQAGANRAVQAGMGTAVAGAAGIYVALATSEPGTPDTATLSDFGDNEVTTGGYSRQILTFGAPTGDPSAVSNDSIITFGPVSADPPEITHVFLCDTSTGTAGTALAYWTLDAARDGDDGDSFQFAAGNLSLSVD